MRMEQLYPVRMAIVISALFFTACAFDLAHVQYESTALTECSEECPSFIIKEEMALRNLPCGYSRKLKANSEWTMIGTIDAGNVYKPLNQSLTIECSNVFEAYLVLVGDHIIGFYLPVEDGYVALNKPIEIIKG